MDKNDLMKMADAAEMLAAAATNHAAYLRRQAEGWETLPDHSDYAVVGGSFGPVSQALADWRRLMADLFPTPAESPAETTELEQIVESWQDD